MANILTAVSLGMNFVATSLLKIAVTFNSNTKVLVESLSGILPLASLGLLIYVRVKYPKNLFSKIVLILYISGFVLGVIAMIVFMVACFIACQSIDTSGCN